MRKEGEEEGFSEGKEERLRRGGTNVVASDERRQKGREEEGSEFEFGSEKQKGRERDATRLEKLTSKPL